MRIKTLALGAFAFLASLSVLIASGGTALAHYVYYQGDIFVTNVDCMWGYSEVSHGTGKGYSKSELRVSKASNGEWCAASFSRPAYYLKIRQVFEYQLAPGWGICRDTGWLYNTTSRSSMELTRTHASNCGGYAIATMSHLYEQNVTWKGAGLWSGAHSPL